MRRGLAFSPELAEGFGLTLLLAMIGTAGRVVVPIAVQQTLDRGINGPDGVDIAFVTRMAVAGGGRDRGDRGVVVLHDRAAVHRLRARPRDAAHQGVPPRPRPAAAHPEHRTARRPGLAGHQRRRPGLAVPGVRRRLRHRQRRPGAARDRGDALLLVAADPPRVGVLPAAVPVVALLPAAAVGGVRPGPALGRHDALRDLRARGRCGDGAHLRDRASAPRTASTRRSRSTRWPPRRPRA